MAILKLYFNGKGFKLFFKMTYSNAWPLAEKNVVLKIEQFMVMYALNLQYY